MAEEVSSGSYTDENSILKYHRSVSFDVLTILIVGETEREKREIATSLASIQKQKPFKIEVHITKKLPFKNNQPHPNIDFIVFMMSEANRFSKDSIEESMSYVDVQYFQGRSCFVVTHCTQHEQSSYDMDDVFDLEENYHIPILHAVLTNQDQINFLAYKIFGRAEIASGLVGNLTSQYLEAAKRCYIEKKS